MKIYSVYQKEGCDPVFLAERFSWMAFLFTPLWALYHRIWWLFGVTLAVEVVTRWALSGQMPAGAPLAGEPVLPALVQAGWAAYVALCAPDWRGATLERRGYRLLGVTTGRDGLEAQRRFLDTRGTSLMAAA